MAGLASIQELLRRSLELNIRYYSGVVRLTTEYVKELLTTVSEVRTQTSAAQTSSTAARTSTPAPETVMVLEGKTGSRVPGVFLVENNFGQEISARVVASVFTNEDGKELQPDFKFDPELLRMKPREQMLVRVEAAINENLEPNASYYGELSVPELAGTRIRVVLRRRPVQNADTPRGGAGVKKRFSQRRKRSGSGI